MQTGMFHLEHPRLYLAVLYLIFFIWYLLLAYRGLA